MRISSRIAGGALLVIAACESFETTPSSPTDGGPSEASTEAGAPTCEADLESDPKSCGRCGHDCFGGECKAGRCMPVVVNEQIGRAWYFVLDEKNVYVTSDDGVFAIDKSSGAKTILSNEAAFGIALTQDHVFFCAAPNDKVYRVQKDGGALVPIASFACTELAANGGLLYVTAFDEARLVRMQEDGGALGLLAADASGSEGVKVDDTHVFWAAHNAGAILSLPKAGGMIKTVDRGDRPRRLTLDGDQVYWVDYASALPHRVDKDGANQRVLAATNTAHLKLGNIVVDETHAYWSVGQPVGGIYRAPKDGNGAAPAEPVLVDLKEPVDIAIDDEVIWFTLRDGKSLLRVAKP